MVAFDLRCRLAFAHGNHADAGVVDFDLLWSANPHVASIWQTSLGLGPLHRPLWRPATLRQRTAARQIAETFEQLINIFV